MNTKNLGIEPIGTKRFYGDVNSKVSKPYCPEESVRKLEEKNNELLNCVGAILAGGLPIEKVLGAFTDLQNAFIAFDTQHRSFEEILKESYDD